MDKFDAFVLKIDALLREPCPYLRDKIDVYWYLLKAVRKAAYEAMVENTPIDLDEPLDETPDNPSDAARGA